MDTDSSSVILSHRLTAYNLPPAERGLQKEYFLQDVIIVGNTTDEVKFSELTLDMYWMIQVVEREPQEEFRPTSVTGSDQSPAPFLNPRDPDRQKNVENPHKYLLYKPTFSQFCVYLASAIRDLPPKGVLLLYISADGTFVNPQQRNSAAYDFGGVATNPRGDPALTVAANLDDFNQVNVKEPNCFYPGDLYPYLRKPLLIIVESDNSSAFLNMPPLFGQPYVILAGPEETPPHLLGTHHLARL